MSKFLFDKEKISWVFYDFANSAYILLIPGVAYQIFFKEFIFKDEVKAPFYWGMALTLSSLLSSFFAPLFGRFSDNFGLKKHFFTIISILTIIFIFFLSLPLALIPFYAFLFFSLAQFFYTLSLSFYDSYIKEIAKEEEVTILSGFAWGFGFLGGIFCFLLTLNYFKEKPNGENFILFQRGFLTVAFFYLIFSLPSFIFLPHIKRKKREKILSFNLMKNKKALRFLIGFFFIMQVITKVIYFTASFLSSAYGLNPKEILIFTLIVQIIGFFSTWFSGVFASKFSLRKIFFTTLLIWAFIIFFISIEIPKNFLIFLCLLLGVVIGSTQSLGRAYLSSLISREYSGEYFGFNILSGKAGGTLGVFSFGLLSSILKTQFIPWIVLLIFIFIGGYIIYKIK